MLNEGTRTRLEAWLEDELGAEAVRVRGAKRLTGGAIQENVALDAVVEGGPWAGERAWVLRTNAPSRVAISHGRDAEFALLQAAHRAGVRVPEPVAVCADPAVYGTPFFVMGRLPGFAAAWRVVRDEAVAAHGDELAEQLGAELARLHRIRPGTAGLGFLAVPEGPPALDRIASLRRDLDALAEPQPILEFGLSWLARHAPPAGDVALTHRDYRTGNYMIDGGRLSGVLDWEFAGFGDPHEDVGWFCAKCWRFGSAREAGGIGSRAAFYRGYDALAERPLDPAQVPYWEVFAAARWGVIALQQGQRHVSGEEHSLDLALTPRKVPEMEHDMLTGIRDWRG